MLAVFSADKLGDELLNPESFYTLREAQVPIESRREEYNRRRLHSSLGNRPPAPEAVQAAVGLTQGLTRSPGAGQGFNGTRQRDRGWS